MKIQANCLLIPFVLLIAIVQYVNAQERNIFSYELWVALSKLSDIKRLPTQTTIDSLQGVWYNEDDTLIKVIITGKNWNSIYNSNTISVNENYRIYFSDTLIAVDDFREAVFDTTMLLGKYIVLVGSDNSLNCNSFGGFHGSDSSLSFGIEPIPVGTTKWISYERVR